MNQKGYTLVELIIFIGLLGGIALGCFGIYVLWHFIAKFW